MAKTGSRRVLSQGKTASTEEWRLVMRLKDKVAVVDPRHTIRQEVDQLDQKLNRHREGSAKLETLPLGRRNR
jgi:hypothetical protein